MKNIVLIAMPGAGKTTIGKILAEKLQRDFLDVDEYFFNKFGYTASLYIEKNGLDEFRKKESQVVFEVANNSDFIIATGGGSVLLKENREILKRNGIIVYIERDLDKLDVSNRPISKKRNLKELYDERKSIYESFSDITIKNDTSIDCCVDKLLEALKSFDRV